MLPFAFAAPAAAQTRAGTSITNVATVSQGGVASPSNSVALVVAERLDLTLARAPEADTTLPTGERAIGVTLSNRGTGEEAFVVAVGVASGSATIAAPMLAGTAASLGDGRTPSLAPGASLVLLIPVTATAAGTVLAVSARAATGSGAPGTALPGAGDGGGDAVVGPTGAAATLSVVPTGADGASSAPPSLQKTQTVVAPDGSAIAVRGATITYTLVARFAAAAAEATIVDPIPAGTAYLPNSLTLDGMPLTDADHVAARQVSVPLGTAAAGIVRTLRFTVVIS
jgi:uncharacterized repeat protein (TIGR01451 family)